MHTTSLVAAALLCMAAAPVWTVPPGADPVTEARPGNIIGIGNSLLLSDKASNITSFNTTSPIAPVFPHQRSPATFRMTIPVQEHQVPEV